MFRSGTGWRLVLLCQRMFARSSPGPGQLSFVNESRSCRGTVGIRITLPTKECEVLFNLFLISLNKFCQRMLAAGPDLPNFFIKKII